MSNPVKIFVISVGILLTYKYLKSKRNVKNEAPEIKEIQDNLKSDDLDQIRINLLNYIELRNAAEGKEISREAIDHDIMLITTVK